MRVALSPYIHPLKLKQAIVGYGKATKSQMQKMTQALLKLKELPRPDHAADALALALCHARSYKVLELRKKIFLTIRLSCIVPISFRDGFLMKDATSLTTNRFESTENLLENVMESRKLAQ